MSSRIKTRRLVALSISLALALASRASQAGVVYQVVDLGTLGGTSSFALAVNNLGQVTGNSQTAAGNPAPRLNAFLYTPPSGPLQNLGTLPGSNNFSRGYSINDSGVVVGESDNNASRAFRYENGVMSDLGTLGGATAVAHAINNAGTIVGASSNGLAARPYVHDGTMRDLGTLAGTNNSSGRAWDISENGTIVGLSSRGVGLNSHATLWENGSIIDLGALVSDANFSQAYAVNDSRQVVGSSVIGKVSPTSSTDLYRAFLWEGGVMSDLGTLASQPLFIHSEAKDINAGGLIVGYVSRLYNAPTFGGAAVLWEGGRAIDLNSRLQSPSTGWNLLTAEGINDLGQIVGYGQFQGQTRAYLLNPVAVPEPSTLVALGFGCATLIVPAARRRLRRGASPAARMAGLVGGND